MPPEENKRDVFRVLYERYLLPHRPAVESKWKAFRSSLWKPRRTSVGRALARLRGSRRLSRDYLVPLALIFVVLVGAVQALTFVAPTSQPAPQPASQAGGPNVSILIHRATSENIAVNSTYLDYPVTNGNPNAVLSATQTWNPGGDGGVYNDHSIGVWYDPGAKKWAIFNQDREPMTNNASFNVIVVSGNEGAETPVPPTPEEVPAEEPPPA